MQVVLYGPNGLPLFPQTPQVVEQTFGAARVTLRPNDYAMPGFTGGHYRAVAATTAIAPAANAVLATFRFAPTTNTPISKLYRVWAHVNVITAVTAQRMDALVALAARGYTVADATNSTALVLAGNNAKMRTGMGPAIAAIGTANAAAGISGGTKTLDAAPFGFAPLSQSATSLAAIGTGTPPIDLFKADDHGFHPPVFGGPAGPEGFVVQWGATALATGTVIVTFGFEWLETLQLTLNAGY